jgi:hypothetical protein
MFLDICASQRKRDEPEGPTRTDDDKLLSAEEREARARREAARARVAARTAAGFGFV